MPSDPKVTPANIFSLPLPQQFAALNEIPADELRKQAKLRFLQNVNRALDALERAMVYGDWDVVVKAAQVIFDRAGFGPKSTVAVEDERDLSVMSDEELIAYAEKIRDVAREQMAQRMGVAPPGVM